MLCSFELSMIMFIISRPDVSPAFQSVHSGWKQSINACMSRCDADEKSGPEVIKLFSCSTQLSTKLQLLIKTKILTNEKVYFFKSLRCCFYHAINVKMPTILGILTFMSRINFVLSCVAHGKSFITLGPGCTRVGI